MGAVVKRVSISRNVSRELGSGGWAQLVHELLVAVIEDGCQSHASNRQSCPEAQDSFGAPESPASRVGRGDGASADLHGEARRMSDARPTVGRSAGGPGDVRCVTPTISM